MNPNLEALDDQDSPSLDVLAARQKNKNAQTLHSAADALSSENASTSVSVSDQSVSADAASAALGSPQELEEEADSEGAFNPETGEINWDCPCLGGMAHGPCGPQFREAFSCFVFSNEEPKGMDCIEKFQGMRDCFQEHPDVYKDELMDDEAIDAELEGEKQELAQQIAERRKQDVAAEGAGQRRLLEEPAPEPRVKATRKIEPKAEASGDNKDVPSGNQATQKRRSSEGKKPEPAPEEKETIYEGQKSQTVTQPFTPPVAEAADPVDALVPRAAHDARDAKA